VFPWPGHPSRSSTPPMAHFDKENSGSVKRKRAQSLGGEALLQLRKQQLDYQPLSPRKKARRSLVRLAMLSLSQARAYALGRFQGVLSSRPPQTRARPGHSIPKSRTPSTSPSPMPIPRMTSQTGERASVAESALRPPHI
jgi:hypothetical protein